MEAVVAGTAMIPPAAVLFALMSAASLKSLEKKPSGNPETSSDRAAALAPAAAAASANLARVGVSSSQLPASESKGDEAEVKESEVAEAAVAEAAVAEAAVAEAAVAEAAVAEAAAQKDRFWKSVQKGLSNKNERLTDSIAMGKAHPEFLTSLYDVPPTPLLVEVINLATTAARANNIRSSTGDLLGLKKAKYEAVNKETERAKNAQALLASKNGGRVTRRRRGGATATELETLVQMIFDQIAVECEKNPGVSLQVADALAILVKSQPGQGDNLVADYLLGVFNKFMAFKKMADKNPKLHIIADVMFAKMEEPFNHFFVEQKSWFVFKNALKADPKVVAELAAKADAKAAAEEAAAKAKAEEEKAKAAKTAREEAEAEAEAETRAANIAAVNQEGDKADSAEVAAEALSKAQEAAREAEKSAERRKVLTTPTAEELRNQAAEEQSRNKAAAAEERAARVNAADNQDEVRMNKLDKRAENAAARAAAEVRAAKAAKSAKLLVQAPHVRRALQPRGGKRRKLRKSTFRRHRKH